MEREFLSKDLNYEFYKLNNHDYNDYLFMLNDYKIEYQDQLDFEKNITFGIEIEYEGLEQVITDSYIEENYPRWISTCEDTISKGGEIISPILQDTKEVWKEIKRICSFLKLNNAIMDNDAGAHIHIGTQILSKDLDRWRNFIYLYTAFEDILYRFASGERINQRQNNKVYAYPISIDLAKLYLSFKSLENFNDLEELLDTEHKFQGINFCNINFEYPDTLGAKNTIEIRMPNGTKEEIIWQNYINTFIHLLKAHIKDKYLEYINNEIKMIYDNYYNYEHYNYIDPKKAFLLADIIFDNNLYKTNFLKQYIKDGKITQKNNPVYARKFIKN